MNRHPAESSQVYEFFDCRDGGIPLGLGTIEVCVECRDKFREAGYRLIFLSTATPTGTCEGFPEVK